MLIVAAAIVAMIFLSLLALGNIYAPIAAVSVLLAIFIAALLGGRALLNKKSMILLLWFILLSHRSLIPRTNYEESGGLVFVEVGITIFVLLAAAAILLTSVDALRFRISEGRSWLLAYAVLAAVSLIWTPLPIYSGFWAIRLGCVALLLVTYFANADTEDCRRFFTVTLLGSAPVMALPIIAYLTEGSHALLGNRIMGSWAHPGVVSITAFSVAAACLTVLLQRKPGSNQSGAYLHMALFALGCTSGFLAAGKTGAIGGGIAIALMLLLGRRIRLWLGMVIVASFGYLLFAFVLRDMQIGLFAHWQSYNFDRLQTVQGRISLWLGALEVWYNSLSTAFFGRGFTAFRAVPIASLTGWDPGHAHNSFINLLLDVGLVGACLFITMLYRAVSGAISMAVRQGRAFSESPAFPVAIALVSLLVGGLMDDVFGGTLQPTTYLFIGTVIALDRLAYLSRLSAADTSAPEPVRSAHQRLPASGQ